ncbi:MAG: formate/nitrite transporter family protein [Candidatus Dormibacteria bacterium]
MPAAQEDPIEVEPDDVARRAVEIGEQRLTRGPRDILITGLIGGIEVSLGGVVAMTVLGAALTAAPRLGLYTGLALGGLVFPVGFLFVILGRSELFTENFLIPVMATIARRLPRGSLATLWALSWVGNVLGCVVMALLLSIPQAIGEPIREGYRAYTAYKLEVPPLGLFLSSVLAGMTMTVLTWLLVAVRHPLVKVVVIYAAGYTLFATNFSHAIVGAAIIFVGFVPAHRTLLDAALWLGITTAGNLVGGVGLVTAFRVVQAREQSRE